MRFLICGTRTESTLPVPDADSAAGHFVFGRGKGCSNSASGRSSALRKLATKMCEDVEVGFCTHRTEWFGMFVSAFNRKCCYWTPRRQKHPCNVRLTLGFSSRRLPPAQLHHRAWASFWNAGLV